MLEIDPCLPSADTDRRNPCLVSEKAVGFII